MYHINLGGGGGTTWFLNMQHPLSHRTGVSSKLTLPGVLFHHKTPPTTSSTNYLLPWIHYIPISAGLSCLWKKCLWAKAHPWETQASSKARTVFIQYMGIDEYWERAMERILCFGWDCISRHIERCWLHLGGYNPEGGKASLGFTTEMGYPLRKMVWWWCHVAVVHRAFVGIVTSWLFIIMILFSHDIMR